MMNPIDDAPRGWRGRVRAYCTALMLTMALVAAPPRGRVATRPAVVRLIGLGRPGELDPRELVSPSVALTLPLAAGSRGHSAGSDSPLGPGSNLN